MEKQRHQVVPRGTCLIIKNNKILLLEFSKQKGKLAGYFDPPGGHIELGEGIIENAEKEIFEETGLKVTNTRLRGVIHVNNFFGKNLMLFVIQSEPVTKELVESDEGTLHWVDIAKVNELKIFDDILLILNKISTLKENEIFTAISQFDDNGKLLRFDFE